MDWLDNIFAIYVQITVIPTIKSDNEWPEKTIIFKFTPPDFFQHKNINVHSKNLQNF